MESNGDFSKIEIYGNTLSGKSYLDYIESLVNKAYIEKDKYKKDKNALDIMWYLWCGAESPLFGKSKAATFERYLLDNIDENKEVRKEPKNPYYTLVQQEETCDKIFNEFGLDIKKSHIINGHIPVKEKDGESPIKANGKLLVIDGGFAKSYRKETGRAGYTLTYNSYGLILAANEPFDSKMKAIRDEQDIKYDVMVNAKATERKRVADTDIGKSIQKDIDSLKMLLDAYRSGKIKEIL